METTQFDVVIIGAGPSGCACAMTLRNSGLKVALIDKSIFPRDKVCGDAIPGPAIKALKQISVETYNQFIQFSQKLNIQKTRIHYNNKNIDVNWVLEAYTSKRLHFDNFLFSAVKDYQNTTIFEGKEVIRIDKIHNGYTIYFKDDHDPILCKFLVGSDGVNGYTSKRLAKNITDKNHHVGAIRQYYSGIKGLQNDMLHIFSNPKRLKGYFWIFPVGNNVFNVGFGMLSKNISTDKVNLKNEFADFINDSDFLTNVFKEAEPLNAIQGCGIPLGSRWVNMSGERFLLAGDAASLAEPIGGDGIANAIISSKLAGEHIMQCFKDNNFSEKFMKQYEKELYQLMGDKMRKSGNFQRLISGNKYLFNFMFTIAGNSFIRKLVSKLFS